MPDYLYPGVYVETYDASVTPIPGVGVAIDDDRLHALIADLRALAGRAQPDWTGPDDADPGITLLELAAWLAELAAFRTGIDPGSDGNRVSRLAAALERSARCAAHPSPPIVRPNFFAGQLLDAATLTAEQNYHREKLARHNRELHGWGIVRGLHVSVESGDDASADRVRVDAGYAIDACGEDIALPRGAGVALPQVDRSVYVSLRRWDRPVARVPASSDATLPSLVEEASIVAIVDEAGPPAVALARLARSAGRWLVDTTFRPQRARGGEDCCSS